MTEILNYQLNYLLFLQHLRDVTGGFFDTFFLTLTTFGEIVIPIGVMCFIYWSLNKDIGKYLFTTYAFSFLLNQLLKMIVCIERPWILNDKIKPIEGALPGASGYSFPSGHTSGAVSLWGGLCAKLWDKKLLRYFLITLVLLIMFSRNYLGVHTPQDVIVSFIASFVVLVLLLRYFNNNSENKIYVLGIISTVLVVVFAVVKYNFLQGGDAAISYVRQMPSFCENTGYIFGIFSGLFLSKSFIEFKTCDISWLKRILRFIPGYVMLILFIYGTKDVFVQDFGGCAGGFIHSGIASIFTTFMYPWLFTRVERKISKIGEKNE